jgi:hypothetical protein
MIDFATITYKNVLDQKLLEIQALSFDYVDPDIINKIYVIFNSTDEPEILDFKDYFTKP